MVKLYIQMNHTITILTIFLSLSLWGQQEFHDQYDALLQEVVLDGLVDYGKLYQKKEDLNKVVSLLNNYPIPDFDGDARVAYYINAYNITVLQNVVNNYPTKSVKSIPGFFKNKQSISGVNYSLDNLEKKILSIKKDGRIHMALVCGAIDCPPLANKSFIGRNLDAQLEAHTQQALHKSNIFFQFDESKTFVISRIFQWYADDFGSIIPFIQSHISEDLPDYKITYADYNWALNDANTPTQSTTNGSANSTSDVRYYASNLYAKGEFEVNLFNNYYSQQEPSGEHKRRDNFFTTSIQPLWGWKDNINIGLDIRIRSVTSGPTQTNSLFEALKFKNQNYTNTGIGELRQTSRVGITQIGPRIKYTPFKNIGGLTFQHTLHIPLAKNSEGNNEKGFIDWGSPSIYNDLFFDHELSQKTSLFVQLGIYGENLGGTFLGQNDGYYQLSTPITTILNYFPTKKSTIYFLINSAPQFGISRNGGTNKVIPNHYNQYGIGVKYFVTERIQAEILTTNFSSVVEGRTAATYNFGVRYYGW